MEFYRLISQKAADSHEPATPIIIMNEDCLSLRKIHLVYYNAYTIFSY